MSKTDLSGTANKWKTMDRTWERVQRKTFTKWANSHLRRRFGSALEPIENIEDEMENGVYVYKLINALYDTPIPKHNSNPKLRPHKLDNCDLAIQMMEATKIKLNFLKPNHLVDHDLKMILGMVWAIILDYQIKGISVEELSAKEGLLLWCRKKTQGYKDVDVKNFTSSFQDGLAFCALIHRHRPDLLDFDALSKDNAAHNLQLAFDVAESIGIPKLLDVEDLLDVPRPDERSVMTYVSEYFHKFAAQGAQEVAGRRIAKVCQLTATNDALKEEYNASVRSLLEWANAKIGELNDRQFENTVEGVKGQLSSFDNYRKEEKPVKTADKIAVEAAFNNLSMKLKQNNRPPYTPPDGLSLGDLDQAWTQLSTAEAERYAALQAELRRQQNLEALYARFLVRAATLEDWANTKETVLRSQENEVFTTPAQVQARLQMLDAFDTTLEESKSRLSDLADLGSQLTSENFHQSSAVGEKLASLNGLWDALQQLSASRRASLDEELVRQNKQEDLRKEFARVAKNLDRWLKDACEDARDDFFGATLEEVVAYESTLDENQVTVQNTYATKKEELDSVDSQLKELGVTDNKYTFLSVGDIESRSNTLNELLGKRRDLHAAEVQRQQANEEKCKQFAAEADGFLQYIAAERQAITEIDGEPEDQIASVKSRFNDGQEGQSKLNDLSSLEEEMRSMGIAHNRHTNLSFGVLQRRWSAYTTFIQHCLEDLDQDVALKEKQAETLAAQEELQRQEHLRTQYANAANSLNAWLQSTKATLVEPITAHSGTEVDQLRSDLSSASSEYSSQQPQKDALDTLGSEVAAAGITENPLAELTAEQANERWEEIGTLLSSRSESLDQEANRQATNESLKKEYATAAESLSQEFTQLNAQISNSEGSVADQLAALETVSVNFDGVEQLRGLQQQLVDAGIHDNEHTQLNVETVAAAASSVSDALAAKKRALIAERDAAEGSKVSAEDMAEINECFSQFDKDNDGTLARHELKACLSALDEDISESALDAFFAKYGGDNQTINKEAFQEFMMARRADSDSEDQILASFKVITGDRDFITEEQLKMIFTGDDLKYLLDNLPPKEGEEGGYDFVAFTQTLFSR